MVSVQASRHHGQHPSGELVGAHVSRFWTIAVRAETRLSSQPSYGTSDPSYTAPQLDSQSNIPFSRELINFQHSLTTSTGPSQTIPSPNVTG